MQRNKTWLKGARLLKKKSRGSARLLRNSRKITRTKKSVSEFVVIVANNFFEITMQAEEPDFTFLKDGCECCNRCCCICTLLIFVYQFVFLLGCCEGACQCETTLMLQSCVEMICRDSNHRGKVRIPGKWYSEDCKLPNQFSCCEGNTIFNLMGRNVGTLVHPYRFARMCIRPKGPKIQTMK